jgi:hypothetical protein
MATESLLLENLQKDERWERVMPRFAAIETQLQELYWEVVDCIEDPEPPEAHRENRALVASKKRDRISPVSFQCCGAAGRI